MSVFLKKNLIMLLNYNKATNNDPFEVPQESGKSNPKIVKNSHLERLNGKQAISCYTFNNNDYKYYYPKYIIINSDNSEQDIEIRNIDSSDDNSLIIPKDIKTNKPIKGVGFYIENKKEDKIFGFDISFDSFTNKYIIGGLIKLKENLMGSYNLYLEDGKYVKFIELKLGGGNKTIKKKVFLNNKTKHKKHFNP